MNNKTMQIIKKIKVSKTEIKRGIFNFFEHPHDAFQKIGDDQASKYRSEHFAEYINDQKSGDQKKPEDDDLGIGKMYSEPVTQHVDHRMNLFK